MRITSIDLFQADIPLKDPFKIAVMEMRAAANVFVRINTDEGIAGWGEASPFWKLCGETQAIDLAAGVDLARIIKGKNPLEIEDRMGEIDGFLKNNSQIRAAFDIALHDILGRAAGMPLYRVLGGSGSADADVSDDCDHGCRGRWRGKRRRPSARDFGIIKIKLGTNVRDDVARVRAIREAVGSDVTIRVDANQGWDVPTAIADPQSRCTSSNIEYCEQPVPYWNLAALKSVHDRSPVPIVADEAVFDHHDAFKVLVGDAADYVNLKLSKSGGIRTGQQRGERRRCRGQDLHDRLHDGIETGPHRRGASGVVDESLPILRSGFGTSAREPIRSWVGCGTRRIWSCSMNRRDWASMWMRRF